MRRRRGPCVAGMIAAVLGPPAIARAQPPPLGANAADEGNITVAQEGCDRLDLGRLRSLFTIEVRTAIGRLGSLKVGVACGEQETRLRVESSTWGVGERSVPTRALGGAEAERLLALAGAQLVFATWLDAQPDRPMTATPSVRAAPERPAPVAPPLAPGAAPSSVEVGVEAGARARALGVLVVGPAASLTATAWRASWGAEVLVGVDRAVVARTLGSAELVTGEIGLAGAWRSSPEGPLAFEVAAGPALAALDLRGLSPAAHVSASSVTGATMDARLSTALRYRRSGFWALARLEGGYLVSGPQGTISGDTPIATQGPWAGVNIGLGGAW